ncbi:MAG: ATP-binding protein [Chloroflexi bacterium CFX6]|nr:ATP-binding protein [Chloroflexi bacterium CFX6]
MIARNLEASLRAAATYYPVVTVTGPRQSGKTTLCRATFPDKPYVSLEPLDARDFARADPRGFLAQYAAGAVIDEVQHAPDLLSYLQVEVDARPEHGRFILTGSQHLGLSQAIAQSLAGRTGVLHLLPLGLDELRRFADPPHGLFDTLWQGGYPRIHDRRIPADRWLADYVATYVQRDVRQILNVGDLLAFTTFLRLCAGRTAQVLNLSALAADAGVSHNTARAWLSVLETSFLIFRLPAWHRNLTSRTVKAAKLHFFDTGLACHLIGIRAADQLVHHPSRGAIFETWVASEVFKARIHRGQAPDLFHLRQQRGIEIDLVLDAPSRIVLAEAKSGATVAPDAVKALDTAAERLGLAAGASTGEGAHGAAVSPASVLVHGGDATQRRGRVSVVPWHAVADYGWAD